MTCDCESCVVPGALIEYLSGDVMSVSVQNTSKEGPFVRFVRDAYQPKNASYVLEDNVHGDHIVQR